jgi:hypothetical protein
VYLGLGKKFNDLLQSKISIYMSQGIDKRKEDNRVMADFQQK